MSRRKNARSSVAAPERAGRIEKAVDVAICNPPCQYNTGREREQGFIESLLLRGAENAIPAADLVRITGLRSTRQLQRAIEMERRNGALILSSARNGGGYYLPQPGEAGKREIADFVTTLHARATHTLRTLKAARQALAQLDAEGR